MKPLAIIALAIALEVGFLFTAAVPAPVMARAGKAVKVEVAKLAHAALGDGARRS
ncbi:MAG TPA: hypothetical protein VFG59_11985 [Anaeromyxobacter sp.]|nr:hypothetical protein [Anaeromyxobacter sp.]